MRIVRFLSWTCLVLAWASTSLAQTASPSPQAPPAAAPAPSVAPAETSAPAAAAAPPPAVPLAPDPYGDVPAAAGTPADPYGGPAIAPAPSPAPQPAPAPAPAPQLYAQPQPAVAPHAVPPPAEYDQPRADESDADKCALGTFCLGPVLTLGAFNPLGLGVHGRIAKHFGFAIDYQFLPTVGVEGASVGMAMFTIAGRWHVAGSAFFLGAGFSYQALWAEGTFQEVLGDETAKLEASVDIPQFMFGLGVLGGDGFVMGIDLALGVPLGATDVVFTGERPSGNESLEVMYDNSRDTIESVAETLLELLPMTFQVNLFRIGYIF
jgi:hypothetical protein